MRYPTRPKGAKRDVAKFGQSFRSFSKHRNGANIEFLLPRMQVPAKDFYRFLHNNAGAVENGQGAVGNGAVDFFPYETQRATLLVSGV